MPPASRATPLDQFLQAAEWLTRVLNNPQDYPWAYWLQLLALGILLAIAWRYLMKRLEIVATKKDIKRLSELAEEGKNAATKRDIEELTRKVESVKAEFGREMALFQSDIQFRNLALTKRLETHQKAFAMMYELRKLAPQANPQPGHSTQLRAYIDWWYENLLLLSEPAGKAFMEAINAVEAGWTNQRIFLAAPQGSDPNGYAKHSQIVADKITAAMRALLEGVQLNPELEPGRPVPPPEAPPAPQQLPA